MPKKISIYIRDLETLTITTILFASHFLSHYIVVRNQYIMYQRLRESGYQEVLNRFIQIVGEASLKAYPNYPKFHIYLVIVLIACGSLVGLILIIHKLIKFILMIFRRRVRDDKIWFSALILSYLIVYSITIYMVTKPMLFHWADYGLLLVNILLISVNYATKSLVSHIRIRLPLNFQQVRHVQQFIDRVINIFFQGFIMLFTTAFIYILFFGYSSYPEEVKKYSEYLLCIAVGIVDGGIYAVIVLRNVYRLLKLEHDIVFRKT